MDLGCKGLLWWCDRAPVWALFLRGVLGVRSKQFSIVEIWMQSCES